MSNRRKNIQSYKEEIRILRKAMLNQKLVVFVGAGTSLDSGMPSWFDAIRMIADRLGIRDDGNLDYMKIPQYYYNARGNKEYVELMREIFKYTENLEVKDVHRNIIRLNTQVIVTTNYDNLIEKAAEENAEFIQVISQDKDLSYQNSEKQLIKIHGDFEHGNFVLKEDDYLHYDANFKLIETYIKSLVATNVVLFIGYSFSDPDVKQLFTWVKDVLADDFQRAYMFNVGDEFDLNEFNYYKNLGINIVYASEMFDQFEKDKASEYTNRFLESLLEEESCESKIERFCQKATYYDSLNYVHNNDYLKLVGELDLTVETSTLCAKDPYNEEANVLLSEIIDQKKKAEPEVSRIESLIGKGSVNEVVIYSNNKDGIIENIIPVEKKKVFRIRQLVEEFDFVGLKNLRDENETYLTERTPGLYLEQAYISYILFEYVKAYRYLRISSQLFFKKKDYVWYFISEFNRLNVGKIAWIDRKTGTNQAELDKIKSEVEALDIEQVYQRIPARNEEDKKFLKDLYTFKYYYSSFQDIYRTAKKTEEEAVTNYTFYGGKPGYTNLRELIQDCYDFDLYNYIMLDRYREDVETYRLYAKTIIKSVCSTDLSPKKQDEDDFFNRGNVRVDKLIRLDLFIILRYMSKGELQEVLRENCYQIIPIDDDSKTYLHTIIKNIAEITISDAQYFEKLLLLAGYIELDKNIVTEMLSAINRRLGDFFIRTNYSELMRFLYWADKQGVYDKEEHIGILGMIIPKLFQLVETCEYKNFTKNVLSRILQVFNFLSGPYETDALNRYLYSEDCEVLAEIYPYVSDAVQKKIREISSKWEWDGKPEHILIYETMVTNEIIDPMESVEELLLSQLDDIREKSKNSRPSIYNQIICSLTNLFLNEKIVKKDHVEQVVKESDIDEYIWLIDINGFSYDSFEPEWLTSCTHKLLTIISSNPEARTKIAERIKKLYQDGKANREVLNIYFEYFANDDKKSEEIS